MRAGKGGTYREVPVHPQLRPDLALWINDERPAWKGSARTSALLLNHRGARLGARGADGILGAIADEAHLTDEFTTLSRPGARFRCCHRPVSKPPALAEPDLNLSAHPAPIAQPSGCAPRRQCANSRGDLRAAPAACCAR